MHLTDTRSTRSRMMCADMLLFCQILACVFVVEMQKNFCWVIQLFSLVCTVKGYYDRKYQSQKSPNIKILSYFLMSSRCVTCVYAFVFFTANSVCNKECSLPVEEAGIIWDSICFFFLLLQRRVFLSFYFLHVSADLQASARQASR